MAVNYFGNRDKKINLPHPFISTRSWIRAIPENGAAYTAIFRIDESAPQPLNTIQRNSAVRIEAYQNSTGLYRPLLSGEIEISSVGAAQVYASRRAILETRAGILQRFADQDALSVLDRAPLHRKLFLQAQNDKLGDEYRVGIVTRPKNTWEILYPQVRGSYAAEEYLQLANPAQASPAVLYLRQQGHVLDESGDPLYQTRTQIALRSQEVWYANDDSSTTRQVDEKGNVFDQLADAATEGYEMEVPAGNYKLSVNNDCEIQVNGHYQLSVGDSSTTTVGADYKLEVSADATYNYNGDLTQNIEGSTTLTASGSLDLTCSAAVSLSATGEFSLDADAGVTIQSSAEATFSGEAMTTCGSSSGITNIAGTQVAIGTGGFPIARLGDMVVGNDSLGIPVVASIVTGSLIATCE
jgi:hypothetical protein